VSAEVVPPQEVWWSLFKLYTIAALALGTFVSAILVYFMVKYREKAVKEEPVDAPKPGTVPSMTTKVGKSVFMLLVSGIIVTALTVYSFIPTDYVEKPPENPDMVVWVTGYAWYWEFEYPNGVKVRGEIVLPTNTLVEFKVTSGDLFHSFGIAEIEGAKIDAIPGVVNSLWITTPSEPGEFNILCYEYCGLGHTYMTAKLIVVTPEEFQRWMDERLAELEGGG